MTSSSSWESFVNEHRGPSYLASELDSVDHPAAELLRMWRDHGVPALSSSEPWTRAQKDACIQRGCHKSAKDHAPFLREQMADFIESKSWLVLPYELVRDFVEIMFSPAAVKDERDRDPRLLVDHSWPWLGWLSVNETTVPHAPPEAMQFGRALPRVLHDTRHANPKFGPVRAAKYDVKDGFYRLFLRARDALRLALVLPKYEDEMQLIGIPLACTMGWVQSPPTFCTMSETVCDLANHAQANNTKYDKPHQLQEQASKDDDLSPSPLPRPRLPEDHEADLALKGVPGVIDLDLEPASDEVAPPSNRMFQRPLAQTDVFMDDFIQLGQGGRNRMNRLRQHLLEAVDQVLAQPDVSPDKRNEAISLKKLLKGDGAWGTRKIILGWILDTVRQTIELPAHRKATLAGIFTDLAACKRVSHKKWQKYLGLLRFVSVAIPGSAGLFSALQLALNRSRGNRIRITTSLRSHIDTFASLAASLASRPTHLAEIVPQDPSYLGATDAAKPGMGGIYYDSSGQPYVWRCPFPEDVQNTLVSVDNPSGRITNSDLEHAALLAQVGLIASRDDVRFHTIGNLSDNTPAVSRVTKGAVSSDQAAAHLCNFACMHQRQHKYCHVACFLPGDENVMADDASRLQHLTDTAFLSHFEQVYPQELPWKLLHLPSELSSKLISLLRSKSPPCPRLERPKRPETSSSPCGKTSAIDTTVPLPSILSLTPKPRSCSSWSSGCSTATPVKKVNLYELRQSWKPWRQWGRGWPTWVSQIPDSKPTDGSIPYSMLLRKACNAQTAPQSVPIPRTSPSYKLSPKFSTSTMRDSEPYRPTRSSSSLWPSSGSSDQENMHILRTLKTHVVKPSSSATSSSLLTDAFTTPLTLL